MKRRDSNHHELMRCAESLGFSVLDTSQIGKGLDLLVAINGHAIRIEIKDGEKVPSKRKLLDSEQDVFDTWKSRCVVWESKADVEALHAELMQL